MNTIDIDNKVKTIATVVIYLCIVFLLISSGWVLKSYVDEPIVKNLLTCQKQLHETRRAVLDCTAITERSNYLLDSMEIHIKTCQAGFKQLESLCLGQNIKKKHQNKKQKYFGIGGK